MYDLELEVKPAATALSSESSPELIELAQRKSPKKLPSTTGYVRETHFNASEDCDGDDGAGQKTGGGKALFALFGTPINGGHHSTTFDVSEEVIRTGAEFLAAMQKEVAQAPGRI